MPTSGPAPSGSPGSRPSEPLEAAVGVAKACSFVLNLLALPALYGFARRRFGARSRSGAMAVLAVLPVHAIYAGFVLRESLVALTSILAVWTLTEVWHAGADGRRPGPGPSRPASAAAWRSWPATPRWRCWPPPGCSSLVDRGRRQLGPLLLWGVAVAARDPPLGAGDLSRVRHARSTRTRLTSNTTSPGPSTTTRRGTRSPSQFYTRGEPARDRPGQDQVAADHRRSTRR